MAVTPQRRIEILIKQFRDCRAMLEYFSKRKTREYKRCYWEYYNQAIFKVIEILEIRDNLSNEDFKKLDEGIFLLKKPRSNKGKLRFYYLDDKVKCDFYEDMFGEGFFYEDIAVSNIDVIKPKALKLRDIETNEMKGLDLC